jgi:uncharacterized heparinase superfamily protein
MAADLMSRLTDWLYASRICAFTLGGPVPKRLRDLSPLPDLGDAERGRKILSGTLVCAGHTFDVEGPDWFDDLADPAAIADLHGFGYLADLAATGDAGRRCARNLVVSWLTIGSRPHPVSWAPETLGTRVTAWLSHGRSLSDGANDTLARDLQESLGRQVRQLARGVANGRDGVARLAAIKGLMYGAASGLVPGRLSHHALAQLRRSLARQILADGIHAERSPAAQMQALVLLTDIRAILDAARLSVPPELIEAITRLAPMLRFFRHGDGRLAMFNGAAPGSAKAIDAVLKRAHSKAAAPPVAVHAGFQRLTAGATLVIQDAGAPASPGFDESAHAGCLAFEMSDGADRMIVNCGTSHGPLRDVLRATAAHSTLVIGNINSAEIRKGGGLGRRPSRVDAARDEMDGNVWVTASHDGYRERFGLVHRRRLYLSAAGDNLRGEDTLIPDGSRNTMPHPFAIRFHLHPDVQASVLQNGAAVLLRLPSGAGWRFQSSGGLPTLEESVYVAGEEGSRRTQQIVVAEVSQRSEAVVKWAFQRLAGAR